MEAFVLAAKSAIIRTVGLEKESDLTGIVLENGMKELKRKTNGGQYKTIWKELP
jgi:hypothetical protein